MTAVYDDVPHRVRRNADMRLALYERYDDAGTPKDLAATVDDIKAWMRLRVTPDTEAPAAIAFSVNAGTAQINGPQFILTADRGEGEGGVLPFPAGDYDVDVVEYRPDGLEEPAYVGVIQVEEGVGA